ncbi:hypothetical protein H2376_000541 [Salmonella enterica]|nr:hypothetical protein [Salmonella enterica]EFR1781667.1 hypothetical protein [Salmonella enterica]EFT5448109.1 hypothetical protein [Salmonella enterica]EGA7980007.1 hypothetical protein [Salmonella enterica]EGC0442029.1 hypothetical protein [Salmonella enterica]
MGICIEVGDKWVITSDQYQFILNEKKVVKTGNKAGEEWLDTIGYYPKINQLISGLIHHHINISAITSLEAMATEIDRIGGLCNEAFGVIKPVEKIGGCDWVSWNELSARGLLIRINKEILHPVGLVVFRDPKTGISQGALIAPDGVWEYDQSVSVKG